MIPISPIIPDAVFAPIPGIDSKLGQSSLVNITSSLIISCFCSINNKRVWDNCLINKESEEQYMPTEFLEYSRSNSTWLL